MRTLIWIAAALLATSTLSLSVLGTFHDDKFHRYGYEHNGAYDFLGEQLADEITENWQSYLVDQEDLKLFHDEQAAHLAEVKLVYTKSRLLMNALFLLATAALAPLLAREGRREAFEKTLSRTALLLGALTATIALLSLRWEWFFTKFHEALFVGQWQFPGASLMLRLWGGQFFPLAAGYILIKNLLMTGLLYLGSRLWRRLTSPRSTSTSA